MNCIDIPVAFDCGNERLLGIVSRPAHPASVGVLIVVGGPQYRAGSHRQFVLLARRLAAEGFAVMRFDYRGMGDSGGLARSFEDIGDDISAAADVFQSICPEIASVVLWGLCDAASASLLYWHHCRDPRVGGLCLLNPWVRTEASLAKAHVKHYYRKRFFQREFWAKLLRGQMNLAGSACGLLRNLRLSARQPGTSGGASYQERMAQALREFPGSVLVILSGEDFTAREFEECASGHPAWTGVMQRSNVARCDVAGADHTFSSAAWRSSVERATIEWLRELSSSPSAIPRSAHAKSNP